MSLNIAQRYAFPEKEPKRFHEIHLKDFGTVELAFHNVKVFLKLDYKRVCRQILDARWMKVVVIHLPSFRLHDSRLSLRVFEKAFEMSLVLGCPLLVVHPSRSPLEKVKPFLEKEVSTLAELYNVKLCWETFLGEKRFLVGADEIARFVEEAFPEIYGMCYDTAHMRSHGDVLREMKAYMPIIDVVHASNHSEGHKHLHIPLFHPLGVLDFSEVIHALRKKRFKGWFVLEYLPSFQKSQHIDYSVLKRL
jgi:sugar phosphate isomerase/epimerase